MHATDQDFRIGISEKNSIRSFYKLHKLPEFRSKNLIPLYLGTAAHVESFSVTIIRQVFGCRYIKEQLENLCLPFDTGFYHITGHEFKSLF